MGLIQKVALTQDKGPLFYSGEYAGLHTIDYMNYQTQKGVVKGYQLPFAYGTSTGLNIGITTPDTTSVYYMLPDFGFANGYVELKLFENSVWSGGLSLSNSAFYINHNTSPVINFAVNFSVTVGAGDTGTMIFNYNVANVNTNVFSRYLYNLNNTNFILQGNTQYTWAVLGMYDSTLGQQINNFEGTLVFMEAC